MRSESSAALRGAPSGDLYLFLSVKPHAFYQRDGADLFCRVPISMVTAALGGEVIVPTLTFTATASIIRYLGAEVVLVDVEEGTRCIDLEHADHNCVAAWRQVVR